MKARRWDIDHNKNGAFHGAKIRLSIGLIVKNEEKTLEKCLNSLLPLLGAVSSELIITDTGSSDHTLEIAEGYTNHIIHHEWHDDFSDARNTGLREACGEWFLFLDGDEWFEDVAPIIDFFNSGECDRYGSAFYKQRNYMDQSGQNYVDTSVERIFKIYPGIHFENRVHEAISRKGQIKLLDVYVNHYGYAFQGREEDKQNKFRRNAGLLEGILEENPNDLRALWELSKEYYIIGNIEKAIEVSKKGLEIEKDHPEGYYLVLLHHTLIRSYFVSGAYQKLLDTLEEIPAPQGNEEMDYLDSYFWGEVSEFRLKHYSNAILYGQEYLRIDRKYQRLKLETPRLMLSDLHCLGPEHKEEAIRLMGWSYVQLNDWEQAAACLKEFNYSLPNWNIIGLHSLCLAIAWCSRDWKVVSDFYDRILSCNDKERKYQSIDCIEEHIRRSPGLRVGIYPAIAKMEREDDFVVLCRLRCAEEEGEKNTAVECLNWFSENEMNGNKCFSDVLYFAAKERMSLYPFIEKISTKELIAFMNSISTRKPDFIAILTDYFRSFPSDAAREILRPFAMMN